MRKAIIFITYIWEEKTGNSYSNLFLFFIEV